MTESTVDQPSIDRKRDRSKRDEVTYSLVIRTLMSTPDGRRFVWLELSECHVFEPSIQFGPDGDRATCFLEGQRSRGIKLQKAAAFQCPQQYIQMTTENSGVKLEGTPDE